LKASERGALSLINFFAEQYLHNAAAHFQRDLCSVKVAQSIVERWSALPFH
jgi:hypothetical protein